MKRQILVVDNDPSCRDVLRRRLQSAGFEVAVLYDAVTIAQRLTMERPSLLLVASGARMGGGLAAVQALRSGNDDLPVIMTGEQDDATERIVALECGADDFISKPFNVEEVLVRVRNVLKRVGYGALQEPVSRAPYRFDGFRVDFLARTLTFGHRPVPLSQNEYALLNLLVGAPGKVFSRDTIIERIGSDAPAPTVGIWVHRLRARIRQAAGTCEQIHTVHGKGYAFCPMSADPAIWTRHAPGAGLVALDPDARQGWMHA